MNKDITFILHGGFNTEEKGRDNSDFYSTILKADSQGKRLLLVPFAKDSDRIPRAIEKVTTEFNSVKGDREIFIETANEDHFVDQVKNADIIYFHGGVSLKLLGALKKYPELHKYLQGKVVAGESAGANVWCKYFYSPHADGVFEGLGILPFKIIPHYKEEYKDKLDDVGCDLEELHLSEYEFKIL